MNKSQYLYLVRSFCKINPSTWTERRKLMSNKRFTQFVLLVALFAVALSACGTVAPAQTEAAPSPEPAAAEPAIQQSAASAVIDVEAGTLTFEDAVENAPMGVTRFLIEGTYQVMLDKYDFHGATRTQWYEGVLASNFDAWGNLKVSGWIKGDALSSEYVRSIWTTVTVLDLEPTIVDYDNLVSFESVMENVEPGYTLYAVEDAYFFIRATDADGNISWYLALPGTNHDAKGKLYASGWALGNKVSTEYVRSLWTTVTVDTSPITEIKP